MPKIHFYFPFSSGVGMWKSKQPFWGKYFVLEKNCDLLQLFAVNNRTLATVSWILVIVHSDSQLKNIKRFYCAVSLNNSAAVFDVSIICVPKRWENNLNLKNGVLNSFEFILFFLEKIFSIYITNEMQTNVIICVVIVGSRCANLPIFRETSLF